MPKQVYFKISEERKEKLLKPAIKEFVSKPYKKITVLSLTDTMKILRTDFYYYFSDKNDILGAIIEYLDKLAKENGEAVDFVSYLVNLFDTVVKLKGPRNRQYLIDLTDNYCPQFASEAARRYALKFDCDCEKEMKQLKYMLKIYKFLTIVNQYEKGILSLEKARGLLKIDLAECKVK